MTRTRMLSGSHPIESWYSTFDPAVGSACPLCALESETFSHILFSCPALDSACQPAIDAVKHDLLTYTSINPASNNMNWTLAILNAGSPFHIKPTYSIDNIEAFARNPHYKLQCFSETTKALSFSANKLCHEIDAF